MSSTDQWKQYLADVAPELDADTWVNTQNLRLPSTALDCVPGIDAEHNKKVDACIKVYQKACDDADSCASKEVRFLKLRWDYVMCYGAGNFLDFDSLKGKICMLNGPNASGKSSVIDVICIGLFGHPTNMRNMQHTKKSYGKLVFDQKPANSPMSVSILMNVDKDTFEITRTFKGVSKDKTAVVTCVNDPTVPTIEGLTAVDTWVHGVIGSLEDVLMSNIVSQTDTDNFLYSKQEQQKEILDRTLRLNTISSFNKVIKESRIGHLAVIQAIKTAIAAIDGVLPDVDVDNMTKELSKMTDDVMQMRDEVAGLEKKRNDLSIIVGKESDISGVTEDVSGLKKKLAKAEKKLAEFADMQDADKDVSLLLKGEHYCKWTSLQDKLQLLMPPAPDDDAIADADDDVRARMDAMVVDKPLSCMSDSLLVKNEDEYKQWAKKQKQSYLDDPDMLQITRNELVGDIEYHKAALDVCIASKPDKPNFVMMSGGESGGIEGGVDVEELKEKQTELATMEEDIKAMKWDVDRIQSHELPHGVAYGKWKRDYDVWYEQVRDALECDESMSDLAEKYQQYMEYIQTISSKVEAEESLRSNLQELHNELSEMQDLPYNAECWACQKQPMRIRQVSIKQKSDSVAKALSKIKKYLSQAGDIDLSLKKEEARSIKLLIDKQGFYAATAERKNKEKHAWEEYASLASKIRKKEEQVATLRKEVGSSMWAVYNAWEKEYNTLMGTIKTMENEVVAMNRFIDDAPHYIDLLSMVNAEKQVREELIQWNADYAALQARLDALILDKERESLENEIRELQAVMDVNVTHMERLKSWSLAKQHHADIERSIAYISLQEVREALAVANNRYTELQSRLLSKKREVSEIGSGATTRAACVDALALIETRYQDILTLEAKFVGDRSTSDGFREYMYTTRLIPELQKHMNAFLGAFDDIQVNIGYSAKMFTYSVNDTHGNSPMVDMASGYQRFIIGLAARAALAKMGAIGHNIKHLFIDEGFTAFDEVNITKASIVINTLQEFVGYHNIMLMSHSDAIKTCANVHINIERVLSDAVGVEVSSLKYGDGGMVAVAVAGEDIEAVKDKETKPKKTRKTKAT